MTIRKAIGKVHLWLGLASGLFVCFLGITGCILAFQREIEDATQSYRFTEVQKKQVLAPSALKAIADKELPGKSAHSIGYEPGRSSMAVYYDALPEEYYYIVYLDPYSGKVLKVKNMEDDFFRIVIMGHYYLWLPPEIGQPVLTTATLIFLILMISGIILWWPKHKAAVRQRFSIKWNAKWKRVNYDLHNVFGFYMTWVAIFVALTGMVMGFQWFRTSVYWAASGGKPLVEYYESFSKAPATKTEAPIPAVDRLWYQVQQEFPGFEGSIEMHPPEDDKSVLEVAMNPTTDTYWRYDYRFFDQHTLQELKVDHVYGRFADATVADKLLRMNYDIHVGAIGGLTGKIIAFFASLIAASLPVTGFLIWLGRRRKARLST
ncbi:PepSY-associated TM helix domain-containing protein [Daejeonella lutea]|uniref:Uncharacterized iron-regulated membrane protein n=1 Tax=Daejeonella lutea TaxID=572036 RepID=A0A1T5EGV8_9SPHI|nr:PepSY-associated TM helix domain-containing protein [Daejeonella lutea]SKB83267.1 Uncharacterized iron-regulated membrane protein [Daejeonella lutea]